MIHNDQRHTCLIYEGSPSKKLGLLAEVLKRKMEDGYRCLYLNSAPMVAGMRSTLAALGVHVEAEIARAKLTLSSDPVSPMGAFDPDALLGKLENALDEALDDGFKGLWASGDMTWEFGHAKGFFQLMDYELKLEELFQKRHELCGICQYHKDTLPHYVMRQGLLVHPNIVINETITRVNPHYLKTPSSANMTSHHKLDETIAQLCKM